MGILFWFKKSKKEKDFGGINCSLTIDGRESNFSTKIVIKQSEWGGNLRRFLGTSSFAYHKNKELKQIEVDIENIRTCLISANFEVITPAIIVNTYKYLQKNSLEITVKNLIIANSNTNKRAIKLLDHIESFIEYKKQYVIESTINTYITRLRTIKGFLIVHYDLDILSMDIKKEFVYKLIDFVTIETNRSRQHTNRVLMLLRDTFTYGIDRGIVHFNPFEGINISFKKNQDLRHLTPGQLYSLERIDFTKIVSEFEAIRLDKIRDLFVFCCYTGFHYTDRENLNSENLLEYDGSFFIKKSRQKTKNEAIVKLHGTAISIIKKYNGIVNLPKIDMNTNNEGLKKIDLILGLNIGLSTKIARKTFTNLCLNVWIFDEESTAKMMGLSSTREIKHYGKVEIDRINTKVNW